MKRLLAATVELVRRLSQREDGNVLIMFALAVLTVIPAVGMAVDVVRMYTVKVQLGSALDAAGLAVASSTGLSDAQKTARLNKFFYGNFSTNIGVPASLDMQPDAVDANAIDLTATATVQPYFMQLVGFGAVNVAVAAQVMKEPTGLEVAFALDNTGSMWTNSTPTNIQALKDDTVDLINILFGATTQNNKLKMSIVPFVTAVNLGADAPNLIAAGSMPVVTNVGVTPNVPVTISYNPADPRQWKGCVSEPTTGGLDQSETAPAGSWRPYWWPSDVSGGQPRLNPWGPWSSVSVAASNMVIVNTGGPGISSGPGGDDPTVSHSPNLACATPITRLTSDKQTLLNAANAMTAWRRSGTMIHVGAAWAWRTISPDSVFGADALAYNTPSWKKALIIESDGTNNFNWDGQCKNGGSTVQCTTPDYTAFGLLSAAVLGNNTSHSISTQVSEADATLDARLTAVCTAAKAKGIIVYSIGFGASVSPALSGCAGNGGSYFLAPTQAELQTAFQTIANQLNAIRLSR